MSSENKSNPLHIVLLGALLFSALTPLACDESLPPYADPADLFEARVWAFYNITALDNSVKVYLTVVNRYDETLEERSLLQGTLVIVRQQDPSFRRTVAIDTGNIQYARSYNPATRVLRLDPGDSIRLGISWDLVSDDGVHLSDIIAYYPDPECPQRFISFLETLVLDGELTLFEHVAPGLAPQVLSEFQHHRRYIDHRECNP